MVKAAAMLLNHIGYVELARKLEMTLDICTQFERRVKLTGRSDGATGAQLADYMMETVKRPDLEAVWKSYQK
jgi:isocitrate dehydrogenase (NAD+)